MRKAPAYCKIVFIMLILWIYSRVGVIGQSKPIPLQQIVFKNKVLEGNLNAYINNVRSKVIAITVERRDNGFIYKLLGISFYERIKNFPPRYWGQWRKHILVFWAGPKLKEICKVSDTATFSNLLHHVRPLLSDRNNLEKGNYKPDLSIPAEGLEWTFKVENGKEVWLYDNHGYDSRDISEVPVPN